MLLKVGSTIMNGTGKIPLGVAFLGLIQLGAIITLAAIFGIFFLTWWGMGQAMRDMDRKGAIFAHEQTFRTLCPDYKNASTWTRWTNSYIRGIGWCADYVDRL